MSEKQDQQEAEIVKFPGIASISLSITPLNEVDDLSLLEALVRVYDENDERIMRQKARSLQTIAKNLKLFIQTRTNLPINDRRMSTWFAQYLSKNGVPLGEEESYQIIKQASEALEQVSTVDIGLVESTDLVSIETDVLANLIELQTDHLLSEDELYEIMKENQCPICNEAKREISYTNSGGTTHKDIVQLEIIKDEKINSYSLQAHFKNETEKDLTDIQLSDIIPYCYKINSASGGKIKPPKKELMKEGLKLTWEIKKVKAGESVIVSYRLEKRIPRTILIRKENEIRIVQDYNSLDRIIDESSGKESYKFFSEVINLLPVTLDEVIIRDLIPNEFLLDKEDELIDIRKIDFGNNCGVNIQWSKMNVETASKLLLEYSLKPAPLLWKSKVEVPLGKELTETIKATKIIESISGGNQHICTLIASGSKPFKLTNEIERGFKVKEYYPKDLNPTKEGNKQSWHITGRFIVSMVLSGSFEQQPTSLKVTYEGKEHTNTKSSQKPVRNTQLISLPFNHVALYRRAQQV
jgi:hypothetical protein